MEDIKIIPMNDIEELNVVKELLEKLNINYKVCLEYEFEGYESLSFTIYDAEGKKLDKRHKYFKEVYKSIQELLKLKFENKRANMHTYRGEFHLSLRAII